MTPPERSPVDLGPTSGATPTGREREAVGPPSAGEDQTIAADDGASEDTLRSRILRPRTVVSFGFALALLAFFFQRLEIDLGEVWENIRNANLALLALGFVIYYATFLIRAVRWRGMLVQAGVTPENGYTLPSTWSLAEIFLLSWFANCVVPAKLGDAYRSFLLKERSRSSFSTGLGTILAERFVDLIVLFGLMTASGLIAFRGHLPGEARRSLIAGSILLCIGAAGVVLLWFLRARLERRLPHRVQEQFGRLHDAIFSCLRRPWKPAFLSLGIWLGDGLRLMLVAWALGAELDVMTAVFVALMSSLLTTLPVTPAGLGVVEAAMIVVLKLVDMPASMAGSIALLDRLITYWSIILVGFILYVRHLHREVAAAKTPREPVSVG